MSNDKLISKQSSLLDFLEWFGELAQFCLRLAKATVTPPYELRELLRQMHEIGTKSLPLVAIAGSAIGVVLSMHARDSMVRFGAKSLIPTLIIIAVIKEGGPIITSLVISGRVGAGIGAELGSMKVTEQVDAIEASAVDPFKLLVVTRVLACVLMLPLLTLVADFCGILAGWLANALIEPMTLKFFVVNGFQTVRFSDLFSATIGTLIFGLLIGIIGCFEGLRTQGGTAGVGRASTSAVVIASLFVILADVVIVRITILIFSH